MTVSEAIEMISKVTKFKVMYIVEEHKEADFFAGKEYVLRYDIETDEYTLISPKKTIGENICKALSEIKSREIRTNELN